MSLGGWVSNNFLNASGAVPDDRGFIGPGNITIPVQPFLYASYPVVDGTDEVNASLIYIQDHGTLSVTYNYQPVPEPRWTALLLFGGAVLAATKRSYN